MTTEKKIIAGLKSGESTKMIEAIAAMRIEGKAAHLPLLLEILHTSSDEAFLSEAVGLLNDLKNPDALQYLITALNDEAFSDIHIFILQSIWQSGLNPNQHLEDLVNYAIRTEYLLCFEVLTIIENLPEAPDEEIVLQLTSRLRDAMHDTPEHALLLHAMHDALNDYLIEG
jgi:HEAT repeat protein